MDEEALAQKKKKGFEVPHVYTICFALMVLFAILTWIVPSGSFERVEMETAAGTRSVAVAGTYTPVDKVTEDGDLRQGIFSLLMAPTQGIQQASDVVAFVLLIGGAFAIITKTNAINAGMAALIKILKEKDALIIPVAMILFGIGGTTFGMSEEALPFYAIFIPMMMAMGYDSMTAFMICFMGPNAGYIASTINPFNVLIAQGIIGVEGNPQLWLRAITWVIVMALTIIWVMRYARKVKANPTFSITHQDDFAKRVEFSVTDDALDIHFTGRQKAVLVVFACGMGLIVWGLITQGWYMDEISAVFVGMGLLAGIVGGLTEHEMAEEFVKGMSDFAYAAVVIGLARSILVIAENGMIIDTILNFLANLLAGVPAPIYTTMLYIVYALLTFLVPSSSGMAALTMPIVGPLTELMGVNPEGAVTAMCISNQIVNCISPTAGMTIAGLGVSKISLEQWWKTSWKFILLLMVVGIVITAISGMLPVA